MTDKLWSQILELVARHGNYTTPDDLLERVDDIQRVITARGELPRPGQTVGQTDTPQPGQSGECNFKTAQLNGPTSFEPRRTVGDYAGGLLKSPAPDEMKNAELERLGYGPTQAARGTDGAFRFRVLEIASHAGACIIGPGVVLEFSDERLGGWQVRLVDERAEAAKQQSGTAYDVRGGKVTLRHEGDVGGKAVNVTPEDELKARLEGGFQTKLKGSSFSPNDYNAKEQAPDYDATPRKSPFNRGEPA